MRFAILLLAFTLTAMPHLAHANVEPTSAIVTASWYELDGETMANGERFSSRDPHIAAHRTLPLGTRLRVTNLKNGKSIEVTIKDRGPYVKGRKLDVSRAAARALGFVRKGVTRLQIALVSAQQ